MSETLREIIFDTETTGLKANDGDRVIEIGAVELINRFPSGKTYHVFVNPEGKEVHPEALKVHGISNDYLKDKPKFADVVDEFLEFFSTGSLIAHNASFDTGFLNAELKRLGKPPIDNDRVIDTLELARRKHPMGPNSLDALCSRYNIDNSKREKHGALLDSEILAEVYIELLGGRQASFSLEHENNSDENSTSSINEDGSVQLMQRPKPLASPLSQEDLDRHRAFVETLGDNPVWKKTGSL